MKTRRMESLILVAVVILAASHAVPGDDFANQSVTFSVGAISQITVSGNPPELSVSPAGPGQPPNYTADNSTTYSITTNQIRKITGVLDQALPPGVTLTITLEPPSGANTAGEVPLSNIPSDLVTGITPISESGKVITYRLSAIPEAGVVPTAVRTVTLTLTAP